MNPHTLAEVQALRNVICTRELVTYLVDLWHGIKEPTQLDRERVLRGYVWQVVEPYARAIVSELCINIIQESDRAVRAQAPTACPVPRAGPRTELELDNEQWFEALERRRKRRDVEREAEYRKKKRKAKS